MNKNLKHLTLVLLLTGCTVIATAQKTQRIYVDTKGRENSKGTFKKPVSTIAQALKIASKNRKADSVEIILRNGTYFFNNTLEIVQGKTWNSRVPLTIMPYGEEKVILHGGKIVNADATSTVLDPNFANRFLPEIKDKIRQIDLNKVGIENFGKLSKFGFSRPILPANLEIFIDGSPGTISRWPNQGTIPIKTLLDTGSVPRWGDKSNRGGVFTYAETTRPSRWKTPQKAWISGYFMWGYADDAVQLKSIDTIKKVISTLEPSFYGFGTGKAWRSWYAYNLPEEIDIPGEYYVDEDSKILYFMPPDHFSKVEISVLETPIFAVEGVSKVTLKNLDFTCSRGMGLSMERTDGLLIDGCTFSNLGMMAIYQGKGILPFDLNSNEGGTPTSRTAGNIVQYVYDNSVFDREGGINNGIINCEIFNTGKGGIFMNSGNRLTLEAGNSYVENCRIHDYNRLEKTYRPGIWVTGVGNHVSNCEVYNAPSNGIFLHGNNHLIEYNYLHHLNLDADDMGALYFGRNPSEQGQIVRYNYFSHIGSAHRTMAVYHDDGACGMQVYSNIFYKAGTIAGFIGGGRDNPYTNNIFIDTKFAGHIDERLKGWAKGVMEKGGLFEQRLNAVNFKNPPYSIQYPMLSKYWEDDPATPKRNTFSKNILVNIVKNVEGDEKWLPFLADNFITNADPGFVNYSKEDFRLKEDSEVWKKVPGFIAIPVEKIGYKSDYKKK